MKLTKSLKVVVVTAVASATIAVGAAAAMTAGASGSGTTYYACLGSGKLKSVGTTAPTCSGSATQISWNSAGPTGATGPQGVPGATNYDLAQQNGYQGSLSQWLASLIGPQGPTGATGPAGPQGTQGPSGTSQVYSAEAPNGFTSAVELSTLNVFSAVQRVTVPAGSYLVSADVNAYNDASIASGTGEGFACELFGDGTSGSAWSDTSITSGNNYATLPLTGTITESGGTISVGCELTYSNSSGASGYVDANITALQVSTVN